ncbi:hypothetical protein ONZ51_g10948 [Trametes cubensis]|uniref:CCHC-type domain-containing protein n=1 Tax=Trametes cubensis TaxID=1111947 RepID=A0AAD7TIG8_9APHY|nr:hypothetical protein ONZ51_g10948 [Trametes cubensis]
MSQPYRLPPRSTTGAPAFDPSNPLTLYDFFEDLEYKFEQAGITDASAMKGHAVRYAPSEAKLLWRQFATFGEAHSYEDFKKETIKEYLGEDGKRLYLIGDLRVLVEDVAKTPFRSASEFKTYSRRFRTIADYLVKHKTLREDERDRLFFKGLPNSLREAVLERLKFTCPEVQAPRQPYTVDQVTAATEFVMDSQDNDSSAAPLVASTSRATSSSISHAKSESSQIVDALKAMAQAVALLHQQRASPPTRQSPPHLDAPSSTSQGSSCHYCGESDHIIHRCPQVEADISTGLIKRNESGQVVLASGTYVPSAISGATLHERVQEFYRRHPESKPAAPKPAPQMLLEPIQ